MKEFWSILVLLVVLNTPKTFQEIGQADSSLNASIVTDVPSRDFTMTQWAATSTLNMTQGAVTVSTLPVQATKKWGQKTILTSNNKSNMVSFTKVSKEHMSVPALLSTLSTSFVAQHQTSGLIKSLRTANVLPGNFASKSASSTTHSSSILSGKEHSLAISSIPSVYMTPEICLSTSQISLTPSSGDNTHLSTSLTGDKSFIGSQEAFTKSAFFDPQKISKEFNSQTAHFSSSNFILVGINSCDTPIHTISDVKLFTKGSVSLTDLPRTWKTEDLKDFPSVSPLTNKETRSVHFTRTVETEISEPSTINENFAGISSISKTTTPIKVTLNNKENISLFNISVSRGTQIVVPSFVESSATYGPPSMHDNSPFTSLLETSPIVSGRSRSSLSYTGTMTILMTPLLQLSVTSQISTFSSSKTKKPFHAFTKNYSFAIGDSRHEWPSSTYSSRYISTDEMPSSYELKGTFRSSKLYSTAVSYVDTGMQSVHSLHSKASKENSFTSPSAKENLPPSTTIPTKNKNTKTTNTYVNLKRTLHSISTISDKDLAQKTVSRHHLLSSRSMPHHSKPSQSSIASREEGTPSPSLVKRQILHNKSSAAISSSDTGKIIDFSSSYSPVTPRSSIAHKTSFTRSTVSHDESLATSSKIEHEIPLPSSPTSFVSPELVVPFSYSTSSRFQIIQSQRSEAVSFTSKTRHQVHLSSSQTAPITTGGVSPSSTWTRRPLDPRKKSSSAKERHRQPTISTSVVRHQMSFWASSYSSVVSTELVMPSQVSNLSTRSKITFKENLTLFSSDHEIRPVTSKTEHQIRFSSAQSSVAGTDQVAPYSSLWNRSDISPTKISVVKSTYHKPPPSSKSRDQTSFSSLSSPMTRAMVRPSSPSLKKGNSQFSRGRSSFNLGYSDSTIGHQIRLSSSQSSSTSIEPEVPSSHSQSSHQAPQERASFATSIFYKSLSSSPVTGDYARFSSSQRSAASVELAALSSHSQSSRQSPQKIVSVAKSVICKSLSSSPVTGHQIRLSSSQRSSASIEFELAVLSSYSPSSLQTQQKTASIATSIIYTSLSSSPVTGHKVRLSSSQGSTASIEEGVLSSHSESSRKQLQKTASVATSIIYKSSSSSSVTLHQIRLSSSHSSAASTELSVISSHSQSSYQAPKKTAFVGTSIIYKTLSSSPVTGHQIRLSSSQSSTASIEPAILSSHPQSSRKTPQKIASFATSIIYNSLSSSLATGAEHVRFSSSQSSVTSAKLVGPSSHTKSSPQVPQRRRSSVSKYQSPGPSVGYTSSIFIHKGKLRSSSDVGVTPTTRAIKSKIIVSPTPGERFSTVAIVQLGTTVIPTETSKSSATQSGNIFTGQPTIATAAAEPSHIKLLLMVAIVPSVILCVFFVAVLCFRRSRRRKNNFKYSIKLEYKDENNGFRSRCANSRLDLSLKGIHIDLALPNSPTDRAHSRDSIGYSRGPSLTETQIRELQILSQECKENLEWISEVIARDVETSLCGRGQPGNRESVYSVKEKGNYEPSEKIIRRGSSKRGRETVKWRAPVVRRRDSEDFDKSESTYTGDTTITSGYKEERELGRANCQNVDNSIKGKEHLHTKENKCNVDNDLRFQMSNKKLGEMQKQEKEKKERELEENNLTANLKRTGKRFETL